MRLLLLAALAVSGSGHGQTIAGTIAVNTGTSLTVVSGDRKLTCAVAYGKGQAEILKWGTGVRVAMACTLDHGRLVVTRLSRLGTTEPQHPTGTTPTTTEQKPTTPPTTTTTTTETRPAPTQERRQAIGMILALTSGGVGIQPDGGSSAFTCAITAAADSQAAAAKLKVGGRAGIVCRLDGGRWVLSGASPIT